MTNLAHPGLRPNIIYLKSDDFRYPEGYRSQCMPFFNTIKNNLLHYLNGVVGVSLCAPNRCLSFTGQHALINGCTTNQDGVDVDWSNTWMHALRANGYTVAGFGKFVNGWVETGKSNEWGTDLDLPFGYGHVEMTSGQPNYWNWSLNKNGIVSAIGDSLIEGGADANYVTDKNSASIVATIAAGRLPLAIYCGIKASHEDTVAAAWHTSTAYVVGQHRNNGDNSYICVTAGTSASSGGGPTGITAAITDGTAVWDYYSSAAAAIPAPRHEAEAITVSHDANFNPASNGQQPQWYYDNFPKQATAAEVTVADANTKAALRSATAFDELISAIITALTTRGILETTYIFIDIDNGSAGLKHGNLAKGTLFEECINSGLYIRVPGLAYSGGRTQVVSAIDMAETFCHLTGSQMPQMSSGMSFYDTMADANAPFRKEALIFALKDGNGNPAVDGMRGLTYTCARGRSTTTKAVGQKWKWPDVDQQLYSVGLSEAEELRLNTLIAAMGEQTVEN